MVADLTVSEKGGELFAQPAQARDEQAQFIPAQRSEIGREAIGRIALADE